MGPQSNYSSLLMLRRRRNAHLILMEEIDAANFTGYFHRLGASFFLGLGKECKQELMHESLVHLIEIRLERDWSLGAQEIEGTHRPSLQKAEPDNSGPSRFASRCA